MNKMTKKQFDILLAASEKSPIDSESLAFELHRELLETEEDIKTLKKLKYIDTDNSITDSGNEFLEKYKIDNAVILAAGMSTRFVPLNYELPKGLLKVKGEALVERQIRQLREKGIQKIIIVVGYMKEKFEYLKEKYGITLVEADDYAERNNHASVYAAREYLKNTIITSSDLYFAENIFQRYAYDSYYCTVYVPGKTAERGIKTNSDDRIIDTFYGDRCFDVWVTLGYAFYSESFSKKMINYISEEYKNADSANKFWADIQDEHLNDLYMYAKRCSDNVIFEFDSLEELRDFDEEYINNSGSRILKQICNMLAVKESVIIGLTPMKAIKSSVFRFRCMGNTYLCDVEPDGREKIYYEGRAYYLCRDIKPASVALFKMDKSILYKRGSDMKVEEHLEQAFNCAKDFVDYHKRALPLCAAENIISDFANLPLTIGFQERYIMNNVYSFSMDDNFIGCEKLLPFYQMLADVCERIFGAKYTDPRPFTGMHCIDMIVKTVCKSGDKMVILSKEHGGHASVEPVVKRLGVITYNAPYDLERNDLDYEALNDMVKKEGIKFILLAPSDIIRPMEVSRINTEHTVLLYDCSQVMGLIAAGLTPNPLKTMNNMIMFGGTHKTFPGPASGLIMTNDKHLHDMMETTINPLYLRHSQMHQKISLLFAMLEFEKYGSEYMSHVVHCSNYLGKKLREEGYDVADIGGKISETHQIFIRCSKDVMDTIYDNAYKCEVTLNKKHKELFQGYGIRLGTQEIARYDWNDEALDKIAEIVVELSKKDTDIEKIKKEVSTLPPKSVHYTFPEKDIEPFYNLLENSYKN